MKVEKIWPHKMTLSSLYTKLATRMWIQLLEYPSYYTSKTCINPTTIEKIMRIKIFWQSNKNIMKQRKPRHTQYAREASWISHPIFHELKFRCKAAAMTVDCTELRRHCRVDSFSLAGYCVRSFGCMMSHNDQATEQRNISTGPTIKLLWPPTWDISVLLPTGLGAWGFFKGGPR